MDVNNYQNQLNVVNDWIKVADQKISILIAIVIGSVGVFSEQLVDLFAGIILENNVFATLGFCIWVTTLGWIIVKLILTLAPSVRNSGDSVLYFGHVATMDAGVFSKRITKLSKRKYEQALIEQIHTNSKIASKKHQLLGEAVKILIFNIATMAITALIVGAS